MSNFEFLLKAIGFFNNSNYIEANNFIEKYINNFSLAKNTYIEKCTAIGAPEILVSVVIVAYRDYDVVEKCVQSILLRNENIPYIELVIVDTGEKRNIKNIIKGAGFKCIYVDVGVNIFPSEARNIGALLSTARWLYFIDDDALLESSFESVLDILHSERINACRGKIISNEEAKNNPKHYDLGDRQKSAELTVEGNLLIRNSLFKSSGGFDPLMYGHEGKELTRRCLFLVPPETIIYDPRLCIKHEPSSGQKKVDKSDRNINGSKYMQYKDTSINNKAYGLVILSNPNLNNINGFFQRNLHCNDVKNDFVIITKEPDVALKLVDSYLGIAKIFVIRELSSIEGLSQFDYSYVACVNEEQSLSDFNLLEAFKRSIATDGPSEIISRNKIVGYLRVLSKIKRSNVNDIFSIVENLFVKYQKLDKYIVSDEENSGSIKREDILVTSFYTEDEYYSGKAKELIECLDLLGLKHDIRPFKIPSGMKWPDVCRKKVGFYYQIFIERRKDFKKLIWIDVDCQLNYWPSFIEDFDVDFMAFRRGFPHSLHKERNLTRHWEPCFFVFNNSEACLKLLEDANNFEKSMTDISATDDYFFEESWRKNGSSLSVFEIPGEMSSRGYKAAFQPIQSRSLGVFFSFGESGNVAEFKGKVAQHEKSVNPHKTKNKLVEGSDKKNNLEYLIKLGRDSKENLKSIEHTLAIGCNENDREAAKSLRAYENDGNGIPLFWWIRPSPGNMGDWLSPYILSKTTNRSVYYSNTQESRIVALGSIAKFARDNDFVWGSGISSEDTALSPKADYLAVRGPHTAIAVKKSGGVAPEVFGDPGILMPSLFMPSTKRESGRFGLVRHFVHQDCDIDIGDDIVDINILLSSPADIENFISQLNKCEAVVTTSLHVMILCISYNIPCRLIDIEGESRSVHGDGIKYRDFYEGVGLKYMPHVSIKKKISSQDILAIASDQKIDPIYMMDLREILNKNLSKIK